MLGGSKGKNVREASQRGKVGKKKESNAYWKKVWENGLAFAFVHFLCCFCFCFCVASLIDITVAFD